MSESEWDEQYRTGSYNPREYPSPLLEQFIDWLPGRRALDIATGNGRNAIFLAQHGYEVDAIDISGEALSIARERADERSIGVNWIRADYEEELPDETYDVIAASFVQPVSYRRIADLKQVLRPDGVLVYEHHVTRASAANSAWEWRSNDLLRVCSDLSVVYYSEAERTYDTGNREGETALIAAIVAQNTKGGADSYPEELSLGE